MSPPAEPVKPFLLLDVDGVLSPYNSPRVPAGYTSRRVGSFDMLFNDAHLDRLRALTAGFEFVWATTWMTMANSILSPRIDLGPFRTIEFNYDPTHGTYNPRGFERSSRPTRARSCGPTITSVVTPPIGRSSLITRRC